MTAEAVLRARTRGLSSPPMRHRPASTPTSLRVAALVVAAVTALCSLLAGPAAAHSDEGEMTVVSATESEPMTISVEVGLVYAGDQHLAEEAEVWVDASTDGTQLEPVRLTRSGEGSSVYAGQFPVPAAGVWTLSFESTDPVATAEASVTVEGQTPQSTTTFLAPTTETTTSAPAIDDAETSDVEVEDDDDGLSAVVIALIVVGVLVLAGAGIAIAQRRRNQP